MLEQLYGLNLLEKHPIYAFLLGLGYSIVGIGAAVVLFPDDPALVAVAFTSIIMLPTLRKLLFQASQLETIKERFSLIGFFRDHRHIFFIYTAYFLGALLAFAFFAIVLPSMATNQIFESQINVLYGSAKSGHAVISMPLFKSIFMNNLSVMILCFVTAFVFGDGGIFLITWNASVWGTIFGNLAKSSAASMGKNPFIYFLIIFTIVFPHMVLEAFSYFCSAGSGGIISKGVVRERFLSKPFFKIALNAFVMLVFALVVLLVAVSVETWVLGNVGLYRTIIRQSFG